MCLNRWNFFVDAVSDYKSDFILFPEYFNAPLMAKFNHMSESEAIRELAKYTDEMLNRFINLAISYNINIITGSMPLIKDDGLYNVGFSVAVTVAMRHMRKFILRLMKRRAGDFPEVRWCGLSKRTVPRLVS